ncbi:putative transposase [Streptomyces sp. SAI-144]|nr:putative transposase [Streptomyces sp. SAI-144]
MLSVVNADGSTESGSLIDESVREGARRMLAAALEAEVNQYIAELAAETDEAGRRLVVRNGHHRPRTVTTAAGSVEVTAPRVNDKRVDAATGERMRFSSRILPPWCRKSPKVSEVLPLLYLHGLSSGDFVPALEQFLGSAAGLSPATVTRLTKQWSDDHAAFQQRDLTESDYVYVWADGVHPKVRLGQAHSCVLVLMGVRLDGTKELIALAEGLRESTESWADLLRDCHRRGMRDPELVVGDGAMGLWKALAEVFPAARHQRCWVHKARNVTNALPKSAQPGATRRCRRSTTPRTAATPRRRSRRSRRPTAPSSPRPSRRSPTTATSCWRSTTSRPSTGSTCAPRTPSSRPSPPSSSAPRSPAAPAAPAAALAMVFKLVESAQARWRAITGAHLVALVRAGAEFENGVLVERAEAAAA